ncbi:MAG: malonate decarboxylase subunit alpha [Clostridiaceae bacterium]|nr:malonate decarboxylase subunit alpha [Clostridiaceae bacterium]
MSMVETKWNTLKCSKEKRKDKVKYITSSKVIPVNAMVEFLEKIIRSKDIVVLEGDNQKQASYLSKCLASVNPVKINGLHMVIPSVSRAEHLDLFEEGIASILDFSFAGSQSLRIAQMIQAGVLQIGAIHTYLELYARLFIDLIPNICLIAADKADNEGNLFTGNNTEETPTLVEATAFKDGIVIAQVNELVDKVDRVDIPGDWVDYVVVTKEPYFIKALFTKDPRNITELQILMGMMCIKGIYAKHQVKTLNHGIGFNTAAIELLLPTYGESLGLKGKICTNWALNPNPTLIPAIESGWVKSICSFGGELGMEKYIKARSDIFATGRDGSLRSNRTLAQLAGLYGVDMFIGSTLQMDHYGNSSTVTSGRLSGFGGAPNMGHNPGGRRHSSSAWQSLITSADPLAKGRKIVVQVVETFKKGGIPIFVEQLDAVDIAKKAGLPVVPVMVYGDDVSHVVTEQGIAYIYKAKNLEERKNALKAIAGETPFGLSSNKKITDKLRAKGVVAYPTDIGIKETDATRELLAAKNMEELVEWSGGLYEPPAEFKRGK